jgi:hypothetical protein
MPYFKQHRRHRTNRTRQRAAASLFARHARLDTPAGRHIGCLCGNPAAARNRLDYYLHLGELVDMLVQETLNAAFGEASA